MKKIPLMNLTRQYERISEELNSAVINTLASGQYILGDELVNFERDFARYCGKKYAIGVGNGTDALTIALKASGVSAGHEVITSAMSFFATAEAIAGIGAVPVFVDCTSDTYTIDVMQIQGAITQKTKAILPVHLYGQCADMDAINAIAEKHNLIVIEDAAQAAGAEYKGKKAGALGDMGCFSLFPTKNLGCAGDGGIIVTDDESLYRKCRAYRVHGSGTDGLFTYNELQGNCGKCGGVEFYGNMPKYYNFVLGHNSRLDTLQAAILNVKLKYLDKWNNERRMLAAKYRNGINTSKVVTPYCADYNRHIYYVYTVLSEERDALREYLGKKGVSSGVYFPVPLHLQKVFEKLGYQKGDMPNAEILANQGLAIPMFAELTEAEAEYIINTVNNYENM